MTRILIAHEKNGPRYIEMERGLDIDAHRLLQDRLSTGYWYVTERDKEQATNALIGRPGHKTPWQFLMSRRNHDHEYVEVVELEKL